MSEGLFSPLANSFQATLSLNPRLRTNVRASLKGRNLRFLGAMFPVPNQSPIPLNSDLYVEPGLAGISAGLSADLAYVRQVSSLASASARTNARASLKGRNLRCLGA